MNIQLENIYKNKTRDRRSHPTAKAVGFPALCRKKLTEEELEERRLEHLKRLERKKAFLRKKT